MCLLQFTPKNNNNQPTRSRKLALKLNSTNPIKKKKPETKSSGLPNDSLAETISLEQVSLEIHSFAHLKNK